MSCYIRWEMTCVSAIPAVLNPLQVLHGHRPKPIFCKGTMLFPRTIRDSDLSSQFWCTMVGSKLWFLSFLARWFTSCSPARFCRVRCSVPLLLHIVFKWYNKRKVLSKLQGFQCSTRLEAGMVMGCYCHNKGRCQIFSLAKIVTGLGGCNRVSQHLKIQKFCPTEWLRSSELRPRYHWGESDTLEGNAGSPHTKQLAVRI